MGMSMSKWLVGIQQQEESNCKQEFAGVGAAPVSSWAAWTCTYPSSWQPETSSTACPGQAGWRDPTYLLSDPRDVTPAAVMG